MEAVKIILIVIYAIVCLVLITLALMQSKEDEGMSSTIVGGSSSNFFDKNKGRTKEGQLKKLTIILGISFVVLTIALSIFYMI